MNKIKNTLGIGIILLFSILLLQSTTASDDISLASKMTAAQNALNVEGFNAANVVGTTFSDSINPYTGALTITQTDVVVPGRNGLDIQLTRQYSSNIFLNINHGNANSFPYSCASHGVNTYACDSTNLYETCLLPSNMPIDYRVDTTTGNFSPGVGTRPMNKCSDSTLDSASFKRGKYLGRGWSMNYFEDRIKDPTPLLYTGTGMTYEYVSAKGINSLSMTINNNEELLILPSMYKNNAKISSLPNFDAGTSKYYFWSIENALTTSDILSNNPFDPLFLQTVVGLKNAAYSKMLAYTSDKSPVFFTRMPSVTPTPGRGVYTSAQHYSKNGLSYAFGHIVDFCDTFDDIAQEGEGNCQSVTSTLNSWNYKKMFNWAENPYAGVYLTDIQDSFGNYIRVDFYEKVINGITKNTPFIKEIISSQGPSKKAVFDYMSIEDAASGVTTNVFDINTRLRSIDFPSAKGDEILELVYEYGTKKYYYGLSTPDIPVTPALLNSVSIHTYNGPEIPGTKYTYAYDDVTQELIRVTLPTGASISYKYAWAEDIPSYDAVRGMSDLNNQNNKLAKRVVVERTITDGGICDGTAKCTWQYKYQKVIIGKHWELQTTVINPDNSKVVYHIYAATTPTLNNIQ